MELESQHLPSGSTAEIKHLPPKGSSVGLNPHGEGQWKDKLQGFGSHLNLTVQNWSMSCIIGHQGAVLPTAGSKARRGEPETLSAAGREILLSPGTGGQHEGMFQEGEEEIKLPR